MLARLPPRLYALPADIVDRSPALRALLAEVSVNVSWVHLSHQRLGDGLYAVASEALEMDHNAEEPSRRVSRALQAIESISDGTSLYSTENAVWAFTLLLLLVLLLLLLLSAALILAMKPHAHLVGLGESLIFDPQQGAPAAHARTAAA
eukprot:5641629-Prymnesium_polylepis.1